MGVHFHAVVFFVLLFMISEVHAASGVTFNPFTTTAQLHEDTTAQKDLAQVDCTASVQCICNLDLLQPVLPVSGKGLFDCWQISTNPNKFTVKFVGTASATSALDYAKVQTYNVKVVCVDSAGGTSDNHLLEVDILPNQQPIITGYPAVTTSTFNVQSPPIAAGSTIYALTVSDPEGDALTYTMTQSPDQGAFSIGPSDGIIRTEKDLRSVTTDTIVCYVTVSDGKNVLAPFAVTVKMTNLNTRPIISNLPATIYVTEDRKTGFELITLIYSDPDSNVTLQPDCSANPIAENYKFIYEVDTRKLKLNTINTGETLLDFETTDKYLISCAVFDGFLYSQGDVLTMYVNNVNEPPVFNPATYYCTMYESKAGVSSCNLVLTVTDPERNVVSTPSLQVGNNSERFRYEHVNTRLTFNIDYDVDNSNMPTNVILTIQAVDSNSATGTAKIEINILDANDNMCTFGTGQAAQLTINQGTSLQTLGFCVATDVDLTSPNNQVTFEVVSGLPMSSLNYVRVFGNGEIKYVGLIPETEHGKSYSLVVRCKDGGTPSLSATGTVQVSYLTTTSTTTTTTTTTPTTTTMTQAPSTSIWDDKTFMAVFAVLMVILGVALIALAWWCCTKGNLCNNLFNKPHYERQQLSRVRPVREYRGERSNRDDFFRSQDSRESPYYRDYAWRSGNHYENGLGYEGRPITKSDIFPSGSYYMRALPAPKY